MTGNDSDFCKIPWKAGGRSWEGADCVGVTALFLERERGFDVSLLQADTPPETDVEKELQPVFKRGELERGDVLFFQHLKHGRWHCAVALGGGKILTQWHGRQPSIVNGIAIFSRVQLVHKGTICPAEADRLVRLLKTPTMGDAGVVVGIVLSVISTALSIALQPNLGNLKNQKGAYGYDALLTEASASLPIPIVLGEVVVAGNNIYTTQVDKEATSPNATNQRTTKLISYGLGPVEEVAFNNHLLINGNAFNATAFSGDSHISGTGLKKNPAQTEAECVDGDIGSDTDRSSFTIYDGGHDGEIDPPIDARCSYDRNAPFWGVNRLAHIAYKIINFTQFPNFNTMVRIRGVKFRTFTASGWDVTSVSAESLSGADGTETRFKLANRDIKEVTSVEVNSVAYTLQAPGNQTGNVYHVNYEDGYITFENAPAASATIEVDYDYYPREWSQNPAMHIAYLMTETRHGKGLPESRIDWSRWVEARDFYDERIYVGRQGHEQVITRFQSNYVIDSKKPWQDHVKEILDVCYSALFESNGKYVLKPRRDGSSVKSFTIDNIIAGSFKATPVARQNRFNRFGIKFHPTDNYSIENQVEGNDVVDQERRAAAGAPNNGIVERVATMEALTNYGQGQYLADIIASERSNMRWMVELTGSIDATPLEPFDIVDVTHPSKPNWSANLFRIEKIDRDEQERPKLLLSEYNECAFC